MPNNSVYRRIHAKIVEKLRTITTVNGYNTTVAKVNDHDVTTGNVEVFPTINVISLRENYLNASREQRDQGIIDKETDFLLDIIDRDGEDVENRLKDLIADIEKLFLSTEAGYSLDDLVVEVWPVETVLYTIDSNQPLGACAMTLRVWYQQSITDPEQTVS